MLICMCLLISCHHDTARPETSWEDVLQMRTGAANVLNKQTQTADIGWLPIVGAGRLAKTPHHENTLRGFMLCIPFGLCSNTICYKILTPLIVKGFFITWATISCLFNAFTEHWPQSKRSNLQNNSPYLNSRFLESTHGHWISIPKHTSHHDIRRRIF